MTLTASNPRRDRPGTISPTGGTNRAGSERVSEPKQDGWISDVRSLGMFGRAWAVGVIVFSVARALIAWPSLGRYGVNPWTFLAIDVITAPPYGVAQAVTVKILRDPGRPPRNAVAWATVVVAMFLAPYIYIILASDEQMPLLAYIGVAAWAVLFGTLAILRMRKQIKASEQPTT